MSSYSALAVCYDRLMDGYDYKQMTSFVASQLSTKSKILDLATGTGEIAIRLAKLGHTLTGVDISHDMLNIAIDRARKESLNIPFICMDITRLTMNRTFDCVTIACDGFNYIPPTKWQDTLTKIDNVLCRGGKLIMDYSSEYKLSEIIASNIFYTDNQDMTLLWTNKFNSRKGFVDMEIVLFTKSGDKYIRSDETHRQYIINNQTLVSMLVDLNYTDIQLLDGDTMQKIKKSSKRILISATKGE